MKAVVMGGGMAGLSAALLLARRGHEVTVLERDATAVPESPAEAGPLLRKGTPQAGHSHAFLARGRDLLGTHLPDVLQGLLDAGVREVDLVGGAPATLTGPVDADPQLVVLASRRALVEWVLRRQVDREPGVTVRTRGATGLLLDDDLVTGVQLDGESIAADLVIDASGRRSSVRDWLGHLPLPAEEITPCGITYYSRFYALDHPAAQPGPLNRGYTAGSSYDRYSCLVFPADNGTFSVTFGVVPEDRSLRELKQAERFEAAAARIELVAPWTRAATPISEVAVMAGLRNKHAPLVIDGTAAVRGLVAIGDAAAISNPAHTRGTTLAWLSALAVAEAATAHTDLGDLAVALDSALRHDNAMWVEDSVEQDSARLSRWSPGALDLRQAHPLTNGEVNGAAQRDPVVWRAFTRLQNLLARPEDVLADPDIIARVRAVQASGWGAPATAAPTHDELAGVLAA